MCVLMHSRVLHIACQYLPIPSRVAMLFFAVMSILLCPLHCAAALYICVRNLRAYFTITILLMSVQFQRDSNVFEGCMCFFLIQCCKEERSNVEIFFCFIKTSSKCCLSQAWSTSQQTQHEPRHASNSKKQDKLVDCIHVVHQTLKRGFPFKKATARMHFPCYKYCILIDSKQLKCI